jgi:hypothetical protein
VTAAQAGIAKSIACRNTGIVSFRTGDGGRERLDLRRGGSRFDPSLGFLRIWGLSRTCHLRCGNSGPIYYWALNGLFGGPGDADQRVHSGLLRLSEFAVGTAR